MDRQSDGAPTHNYRYEVRIGRTEVSLIISVIVGVWVYV